MKTYHFVPICGLILALTACVPPAPTPSVGDIQTAIAETEAAQPEEADTPLASSLTSPQQPTSSPNPTITPTPSGPIPGTVAVLFLNMRQGPGTMHEVVATYQEGTEITARARVPENDWVQVEVQLPDGEVEIGWMYTPFIELEDDVSKLAVANIPDSLKISGRVETISGVPLPDITIVVLFEAPTLELRADVVSNARGEFVVYLPQDLLGNLDVQVFAHGCNSPVMDDNCNFSGYIQMDHSFFVPIPQQLPIIFKYQPTSLTLEGTVQTRGGTPVEGIDILAERDDGARSFGISGAEGAFTIPIDEGIWEVFVRDADTGNDGPSVSVTVTNVSPEAVELTAP